MLKTWKGWEWSFVQRHIVVALMSSVVGLVGCSKDDRSKTQSVTSSALTLGYARWVQVSFPSNFPTDVRAVWSNGKDDVWIGAYDPNCATTATVAFSHWDGASWTNSPATNLPFCPNAISGNSSGAVFAVGNGGKVASLNGTTWTVDYINSTYRPDLVALWVGSSTDAWVFSRSTSQFQLNNSGWNRRYYGAAYNPLGGGAYFDGKAWSSGDCATIITCNSSTSSCGSAYGPWCAYGPFYDIWGTSSTNYWVISSNIWNYTGYIAHYTTGWWNPPPGVSSTYYNLKAIWGNSANDIWFVGGSGKMFHWDGSNVNPISSGTTASLTDIHGTASDEVWAVGNGVVLHYNRYISEADARHRVVQECSLAMTGSYTQYDESTWPATNPLYANYAYTSSDLGAWNLLTNQYGGDNVSCRHVHDSPPYEFANGVCGVYYGWAEMPEYTSQTSCLSNYMRGGQCKAFMNLVAYRSGIYQAVNFGWKSLPSDSQIDVWSQSSDQMPPATYANIEAGDFLRKTTVYNGEGKVVAFGHALIVVRKIDSSNIVVFDSNYVSDGCVGGNDEVVGSHVFNVDNLDGYRVLKCIYTDGCL